MQKMVSMILRQHGTDMTLTREGKDTRVKGFFQPVRSKSWQSLVDQSTPLGEIFRGQYIYIGPADVAASEGDILTVEGKSYFLRRVERYLYRGEPVYTWGMCVEKGVNDTWGSRS
ncbi:MAG: hypothetical protein IKK72_06100 [Oscillospiraceae bacterium]|nr:hypothetical protein [Oscillospiraceae bacterium]